MHCTENHSLVTEIYVKDYIKYDKCDADKTSQYTTNGTLTFENNSYKFIGTEKLAVFAEYSGDAELSAIINTDNRNAGLAISESNNDLTTSVSLYGVSSATGLRNNITMVRTSKIISKNTEYLYRLEKQGTTYTGIIETLDGTQIGSWNCTNSGTNKYYGIMNAWSNTLWIREIKVKPL